MSEAIDTQAVAHAVIEKSREAISDIKHRNNELEDRVLHLEQRGIAGDYGAPSGLSIGAQVVKSDQYKAMISGHSPAARVEVKTAIINATGQNQPLVPADRLSGVVHGAERRLTVRDLLAQSPTSSNMVEFCKEASFTNNAGPQIGGSPEAYENVTKPESAFTYSLETAPVITLAHWVPISKQVFEDSAALSGYISGRLMYGLKLKEENQLLNGTGSNHQLSGLYTGRTAYSVTSPVSYTTRLDILRDAMAQVQASDYETDGIIVNPADWKEIQLAKDSQLRYIFGDPANDNRPSLWGIPVVATNSLASGTFLVGNFGMAAEIFDRQMAVVEMGYNADDFSKNMLSLRCELRLTLAIYRADALVGGSFTVT